jgi:opacity protein-like surface antigen
MTKARTLAILLVSVLTVLSPVMFLPSTAVAESYFAGKFGVTFPQSLSDGKATQDGIGGLEISDQPLKSSLNVGAKFGHYFSRARWLGIETGLSYTTPHIKEGSLTFTGPGGSLTSPTLSGVHQRVITWEVATLLFRYPGNRLQPYIGIGPALFFASLKGPTAPPGQSGTAIGLNSEVGIRYFITRHWAIFGEGTYQRARIGYISNDSNAAADPFGFRANYSVMTLDIGIGYHF